MIEPGASEIETKPNVVRSRLPACVGGDGDRIIIHILGHPRVRIPVVLVSSDVEDGQTALPDVGAISAWDA